MKTFYNHLHAQHQGKVEMFRGALVPCYEVPARADHVLAELQRRKLGSVHQPLAFDDAVLEASTARATSNFWQALGISG